MAKTTPQRKTRRARGPARSTEMIFRRRNYVLLAVGVAAIVVGYLMMGLENEVKGFISLYVAPLLILAGYLEVIYAILWRPHPDADPAA